MALPNFFAPFELKINVFGNNIEEVSMQQCKPHILQQGFFTTTLVEICIQVATHDISFCHTQVVALLAQSMLCGVY